VRELLARGADPSREAGGEAPLHSASDVAVARELLRAGANVNARNSKGETPLVVHAMVGSWELLRCLVEAGTDVNARPDDEKTALRRLFDRSPPETELAELLVNAGGDVNEVDSYGFGLLDYYLWRLNSIVRTRQSDPLRALYYKDDFVEERTRLVEFVRARGATEHRPPAKAARRGRKP
jgi:Ankyrin repeats (3 copies)